MDQLCHVRRVRDLSFDKHQYLTAAFWADKAVSISEGAKEDMYESTVAVYWLASTLCFSDSAVLLAVFSLHMHTT